MQVELETNVINYIGPGTHDSEATVRTAECIPATCPLNYFEVEIVHQGETAAIGEHLQSHFRSTKAASAMRTDAVQHGKQNMYHTFSMTVHDSKTLATSTALFCVQAS